MDRNSTTGLSDGREGQGRQSRSPERRNRPGTSQERENHYLRHLRSVSRDSPSTSDTNHTTASELGQQRGQDHQQHDGEQERQANILRRMLDCMLDCILPASDDSMSNVNNHRYRLNHITIAHRQYMLGTSLLYEHRWHEPEHRWHEPEPSWRREERQRQEDQRQERERQERRGQLLGINLSEVKEERWIKFGQDLLLKHGDLHLHTNEEDQSDEEDQIEKKDLRLLGDIIIQYGTSKKVRDEERESKAYADLKTWVCAKWEEWNKKN